MLNAKIQAKWIKPESHSTDRVMKLFSSASFPLRVSAHHLSAPSLLPIANRAVFLLTRMGGGATP